MKPASEQSAPKAQEEDRARRRRHREPQGKAPEQQAEHRDPSWRRFTPEGEGTVFRLRHSGLPTDEQRKSHRGGWVMYSGRLAALLI
jgi:hypothetical protein